MRESHGPSVNIAGEVYKNSAPEKLTVSLKTGQTESNKEVSSTFAVWLSADILNKYKSLPGWKRKLVRDAIKSFMAELVENVDKVSVNVNAQNVILNINMPVSVVKAEDTGDVELLKERIKELEREKVELKKLLNSYRERAERAEELEARLRELEAELKRVKDELERLRKEAEHYMRKSNSLERSIKYLLRGHISFEEFKRMHEKLLTT